MNYELEIGESYNKEDLEALFNTRFGWFIKGITLRKDINDNPYIILFSTAKGPYSDAIIDNILYYDGEGQDKDQELTAANKALLESYQTGRTIYGFRKEAHDTSWTYIGILEVLDYEYRKKKGYMTYEFKILITGIEYLHPTLEQELLNTDLPQLHEDQSYSPSLRKKRSYVFSSKIKELYHYTCAVCGKRRFTQARYPEVEAAHIYPVERNGSNDIRNGVALCKLHHWAFDGGLFSLTNEYEIIIKEDIKEDTNYQEIYAFEGNKIILPHNKENYPHEMFLTEHRKIHGFE